jgi:phage terminase Nu1 subunit (DNA packaging protein)
MPLITQAEAARILGISAPAVNQAVRQGRIKVVVDENGKKRIDGATLAEDYRRKTQTKKTTGHKAIKQAEREGLPQIAESPGSGRISRTAEYIPDYDESRARTEHLKAELLELDRKQKQGLLVPMADVQTKWVEIVSVAKTKILGIPSKAKQRIPELDSAAMSCLEDIIYEALEDLASGGE